MVEWPPQLIKALARRRAVIVIGSGVSKHSRGRGDVKPPTWREFLKLAVLRVPATVDGTHICDAIAAADMLHACEWIKKHCDEEWTTVVREIFQDPGFSPADIHYRIVSLDARLVFTLNFDDIYERAAQSVTSGTCVIKKLFRC